MYYVPRKVTNLFMKFQLIVVIFHHFLNVFLVLGLPRQIYHLCAWNHRPTPCKILKKNHNEYWQMIFGNYIFIFAFIFWALRIETRWNVCSFVFNSHALCTFLHDAIYKINYVFQSSLDSVCGQQHFLFIFAWKNCILSMHWYF